MSEKRRSIPEEIQEKAIAAMKDGMKAGEAVKAFKVSAPTINNWRKKAGLVKSRGGKTTGNPSSEDTADKLARVLNGKGFKIDRIKSLITGDIVEKTDPKINKLKLNTDPVPETIATGERFVSHTGTQLQVTMTLEDLLAVTGTVV